MRFSHLLPMLMFAGCVAAPQLPDAGPADAGPADGGNTDAGWLDAGWLDVGLNDVSVLFPLTTDPAQIATGYLSASSSGPRGVLLPSALYDAVGHIGGSSGPLAPGGVNDAAYTDLYVVGFRIDPCFAAMVPDPHGGGCLNQLRLIIQEVRNRQGVFTFDSAMHVFYALTRDELLQLSQAVAALHRANGGVRSGALAPDPALVAQGLDGALANGLRTLVLQYAGKSNLTRVTKLTATQPNVTWAFSGFDVTDVDIPTVSPMVIPSLPGNTTSQTLFRGIAIDLEAVITPPTTGSDDLTPLTNAQTAAQLDGGGLGQAFDSLVRVENPTFESPNTIDCVSCHLATPADVMVAQPLSLDIAANPNRFVPDPMWVAAGDMTATFTAEGAQQLNLHAFSYVGADPGINQRTVNESAGVVGYLNSIAHQP